MQSSCNDGASFFLRPRPRQTGEKIRHLRAVDGGAVAVGRKVARCAWALAPAARLRRRNEGFDALLGHRAAEGSGAKRPRGQAVFLARQCSLRARSAAEPPEGVVAEGLARLAGFVGFAVYARAVRRDKVAHALDLADEGAEGSAAGVEGSLDHARRFGSCGGGWRGRC